MKIDLKIKEEVTKYINFEFQCLETINSNISTHFEDYIKSIIKNYSEYNGVLSAVHRLKQSALFNTMVNKNESEKIDEKFKYDILCILYDDVINYSKYLR